MKRARRTGNIRRYRNMPMDAVVALLADTGDDVCLIPFHSRTRRLPK